mmetsp:Transcript_2019/g.5772  ORF Transcript_2019/g.5772 Transcript_2019/m.5772 type:complete len:218 (+) Transcript_2019:302-955(+)
MPFSWLTARKPSSPVVGQKPSPVVRLAMRGLCTRLLPTRSGTETVSSGVCAAGHSPLALQDARGGRSTSLAWTVSCASKLPLCDSTGLGSTGAASSSVSKFLEFQRGSAGTTSHRKSETVWMELLVLGPSGKSIGVVSAMTCPVVVCVVSAVSVLASANFAAPTSSTLQQPTKSSVEHQGSHCCTPSCALARLATRLGCRDMFSDFLGDSVPSVIVR